MDPKADFLCLYPQCLLLGTDLLSYLFTDSIFQSQPPLTQKLPSANKLLCPSGQNIVDLYGKHHFVVFHRDSPTNVILFHGNLTSSSFLLYTADQFSLHKHPIPTLYTKMLPDGQKTLSGSSL